MRLGTSFIAIVVIAAVAAAGWAVSSPRHDVRSSLSQGLDLLPADTRVAGFTDWGQIRTDLDFGDDAGIDVGALVSAAFERDLAARSVLQASAPAMQESFGWSVGDLRWEMYGQATDGSVVVAGMDDDLEEKEITTVLSDLGYTESGGIWSIVPDELPTAAPGADPLMTNIAVLDGKRTIVMSAQKGYLGTVLDADRSRSTLAGVTAAREAAGPLVGAHSVLLEDSKDACKTSGFDDQPADVITRAENRLEPLGALATVAYGGRAIYDRGGSQQLRFSMTFGSAAEASRQLALRQKLTTGDFIGRSGSVKDVLTRPHGHTDGPAAVLDFDFDRSKGSFMSGVGPVLFAACSA